MLLKKAISGVKTRILTQQTASLYVCIIQRNAYFVLSYSQRLSTY